MGLFDQIAKEPQTAEQRAELEKWHEGVKAKAAAALQAREERFEQAERDFDAMVLKGANPDEVVGDLKPLKIEKDDVEESSGRSIEIISDHFSPEAMKQEFLPREAIQPPPMRQVVREIRPEPAARAVPAPVPVISDASLNALTVAVNELSRRLDTVERNQTEIANRTLNAMCNSLNEMLSLFRKEMAGVQSKLIESFKPTLDSLEQLKEELKPKPLPEPEPEPEPETQESARPEPVPEPVPEQTKSLGEICLNAYRSLVPCSWPSSPDEPVLMELAYDRILASCDYDKNLAVEKFYNLVKEFNKTCLESGATRHPKTFYEWVKTLSAP